MIRNPKPKTLNPNRFRAVWVGGAVRIQVSGLGFSLRGTIRVTISVWYRVLLWVPGKDARGVTCESMVLGVPYYKL